MQHESKTIIFFGTEDFSLSALRALTESGYDVGAVVTKPDAPKGRGLQLREPAVKAYARSLRIPVWQPQRLMEIAGQIEHIENRIGILCAYGKIIPESILGLFPSGIINIHPSLLPRYRGPSPIETAILRGESQTGVSLMRLISQMDAGPVYAQQAVQLTGTESASELYETLGGIGASLLTKHLPAIIDGSLAPQPQSEDQATYTQLLRPSDSFVDPTLQSAPEIERHIRAYDIFPRTKLSVLGKTIIIRSAHPTHDNKQAGLVIACRDDTYLVVDSLVAPSGRTMDGASFIRGYSDKS